MNSFPAPINLAACYVTLDDVVKWLKEAYSVSRIRQSTIFLIVLPDFNQNEIQKFLRFKTCLKLYRGDNSTKYSSTSVNCWEPKFSCNKMFT